MMRLLSYLFIVSIVLIGFSSCDSDDIDNNPPEIEFNSISPEPAPLLVCGEMDPVAIYILGGQSLVIDAVMTDDIDLSQLKIDIHPNFDCHGHRSLSTDDWIFLELVDLEGTRVEREFSFEVPDMVTVGFYHLQLRVVDAAGNSSPTGNFWNLYVRNPHDTIYPELTPLHPTEDKLSIERGETIEFTVELSDNRNLELGGNARVELTYRRANSDNFFTAVEKDLSIPENKTEVGLEFTIPQTLVQGDYLFFITGFDGVNNQSERIEYQVEIN